MRLLVAGIVALVLAIALAVAGYLAAHGLVAWRARGLGATELILTSPSEPFAVQLWTALAFALPAVIGFVAVAIHRIRAGAPTHPRAILAYFALALAGGALAIALPTLLTPSMEDFGDLRPMISLRSLAPGETELALEMLVAIGLWIAAALRARA